MWAQLAKWNIHWLGCSLLLPIGEKLGVRENVFAMVPEGIWMDGVN